MFTRFHKSVIDHNFDSEMVFETIAMRIFKFRLIVNQKVYILKSSTYGHVRYWRHGLIDVFCLSQSLNTQSHCGTRYGVPYTLSVLQLTGSHSSSHQMTHLQEDPIYLRDCSSWAERGWLTHFRNWYLNNCSNVWNSEEVIWAPLVDIS